ncbi:MAG: DUF4423 domain-containing protein [Myxococcota bacterium]
MLRAFRGARSQEAFRRLLGRRSNVSHTWENGHRFPSTLEFHRVAARVGVSPVEAWRTFLGGQSPPWLDDDFDLTDKPNLGRLLGQLHRAGSLAALCRGSGFTRHAAVRWLRGESAPRLPDLLRYVHATTQRLADFAACWVDPEQLPSLTQRWLRLEAARTALAQDPSAQLVRLAVELWPETADRPPIGPWLAEQLGLEVPDVERCLELLVDSGQLARRGAGYVVTHGAPVTARASRVGTGLKARVSELGTERVRAGDPEGLYSYAVFVVSDDDYEAARAILAEAYERLRRLAAESTRSERLVAANLQLFPLVSVD